MADYIPLAIQAEIMKRLPTRSLLQFRSVSKQWKSLIDSSQFIVDYSLQHTQQQHLLVSYIESGLSEYVSIVDDDTFPQQKMYLTNLLPRPIRPRVLGVSQGLFCVYSCDGAPHYPGNEVVALSNPSIRKSIVIALPAVLDRCYTSVVGFGVCPHTSDPKVVKVSYIPYYLDTDAFPWKAEVYALSLGAWRSVSTSFRPRSTILMTCNQVAVNDFIYWLAVDVIRRHAAVKWFNLIMSFDMSSEKFKVVSLPETLTLADKSTLALSKLHESLVVLETATEAQKQVYSVWMMERDVRNSFTKLFTINAPDDSVQRLLGFRKEDEPIFEMRSWRSYFHADDFFVRRINSEDMDYIGIYGKAFLLFASFYTETLLLLNH